MSESPKPWRFVFSLRTLLFAMACVAAFFAARELFVRNHDDGLGTTIARAKIVSSVCAATVALYVCVVSHPPNSKHRSRILRATLVGGTTGLLVAACLGVEIAEAVHRLYPEYWKWSRDSLEFVWIITRITIDCVAVSLITSSLYCWSGPLVARFGSAKSRP